MFQQRAIAPESLALRMAELIPEYLPGMDTGAAEPTDRRLCWNKTLKAMFKAIASEQRFEVEIDPVALQPSEQQLQLNWKRGDGIMLAVATGWGDRAELEMQLQRMERLKAGQKIFIYTCNRWQQAVLEQIHAALLRYPLHIEGEQYLFVNLLGSESRMHIYFAELKFSGVFPSYSKDLLKPLTGSPFTWKFQGQR